jgi:hypothetical protein
MLNAIGERLSTRRSNAKRASGRSLGDRRTTRPISALVLLKLSDNLPQDRWVKNDNAHNKLLTEWKTQSTIMAGIICQEQVDQVAWLAPKRLNFNFDDG